MSELTPTSAADARERIANGALLIDVRSAEGRAAGGTIVGATVVAKTDVAEFASATEKDRDIVVFCGSIDGSGPFVDYLDDQGFSAVTHVDGGFQALVAEGLPAERPTAAPAGSAAR